MQKLNSSFLHYPTSARDSDKKSKISRYNKMSRYNTRDRGSSNHLNTILGSGTDQEGFRLIKIGEEIGKYSVLI